MSTSSPLPATDLALGTVAECWRYPVKSLQGLSVESLDVEAGGVAGDRTRGLVEAADDGPGRVLSAKRVAALLLGSADDEAITLPDGRRVGLDDPTADATLSAWLDRPVRLARPAEAGPVAYQMTFDPPNDEAELYDIPTPAGTFLDLAAVHLVTTATLRACAQARPDLDWDVRRFRPNVLLDVDGPAFVEGTWMGQQIRVGDTVLAVDGPTVRCAMPLRAQPGLAREPGIFRALEELNEVSPNHLGAYCSVVEPGPVRVGDRVELLG